MGLREGTLSYHKGGDWPEEQVEQLLSLNSKGLSASVIGREMGITRNAVIGKLHRLNGKLPPEHELARKAAAACEAARVRRARNEAKLARVLARLALPRPKAPYIPPPAEPLPVAPPAPVGAKGVTIMGLDPDVCKWPLNDAHHPDDQFYCGEPSGERVYCPSHHRLSVSDKPPYRLRAPREFRMAAE
jgi:GcrA cell cycle regulator